MGVNILRRAGFNVYALQNEIPWKAARMSYIAAGLGGTDAMAPTCYGEAFSHDGEATLSAMFQKGARIYF